MPSNTRYHRQPSAKRTRPRLPETGRPAELMQRPVRGSGDRKKPALLTNCITSVPAKVGSVATRRAGSSYGADFPPRNALRFSTQPRHGCQDSAHKQGDIEAQLNRWSISRTGEGIVSLSDGLAATEGYLT